MISNTDLPYWNCGVNYFLAGEDLVSLWIVPIIQSTTCNTPQYHLSLFLVATFVLFESSRICIQQLPKHELKTCFKKWAIPVIAHINLWLLVKSKHRFHKCIVGIWGVPSIIFGSWLFSCSSLSVLLRYLSRISLYPSYYYSSIHMINKVFHN